MLHTWQISELYDDDETFLRYSIKLQADHGDFQLSEWSWLG